MKTAQNGFTLIELMIIVAIIGILMTVVIPAYSAYTDRSKISEVMVVAGVAKGVISEYYMTAGQMPTNASEANLNTNASQSEYISAISLSTTATTATVTYTIANTAASGDIALVGTAGTNGVKWVCNTAATTVDQAYLPLNCRS